VVHFFDPDGLAGEGYAEVDLFVVQAKTSAAGHHDGAVVERVVRIGDAKIVSNFVRGKFGEPKSPASKKPVVLHPLIMGC
jgi:hypothetical protein